MSDLKTIVDELLEKAAKAEKSEDALRFTQAALNAAHTKHALEELRRETEV
jgi:hypothetical protein